VSENLFENGSSLQFPVYGSVLATNQGTAPRQTNLLKGEIEDKSRQIRSPVKENLEQP
jgi:hypothetical protein